MNKQIEEMADALRTLDSLQYNPNYTVNYQRAVGLYSLGYRKVSDVAREIFEEIEREIKNHGICYARRKIAEIKKKYEVTEDES